MINIGIVILILIWIVTYIKNKKTLRTLPYLLIIFITPFYNILDSKIFVKVFGCGCVPIAQTNMFNIDFNANDLRFVVYNILSVLMLVIGIYISKDYKNRYIRFIYNITIIIFNLILSYLICSLYMWG